MLRARHRAASLFVVALLAATTGAAAQRGFGRPAGVPSVITATTVELAAERLLVDRWYPPPPPPPGGLPIMLPVDLQILQLAEQSADPRVRVAFVRALGRFEEPADVGRLWPHLHDEAASVRRETARALVQSLINARSAEDAPAIKGAFDALRGRLLIEPSVVLGSRSVPTVVGRGPFVPSDHADVSDALFAAIGDLPLAGPDEAEAVRIFAREIAASPPRARAIAAMKGLTRLARHDTNLAPSPGLQARLRQIAVGHFAPDNWLLSGRMALPVVPPSDGDPTRLEALKALAALHETDEHTIETAAEWACASRVFPRPIEPCDEIHLTAVRLMDGMNDAYDDALRRLVDNVRYEVRLAALHVVAQALPRTKSCAPIIRALDDPIPHVALRAIDLLSPTCEEKDEIARQLKSWAMELADPDHADTWQPRVHALEQLARFLPDDAKKIANDIAAPSTIWQVRASAARVAATLNDAALAVTLSRDSEPNVATAALEALSQLHDPARIDAALRALDSRDYLLVLTGAMQLRKTALTQDDAKGIGVKASTGLMSALHRITLEDKDTSRDVRIELLQRLADYGDPNDIDQAFALKEYLKDTDPFVASAAADTLEGLTGARPVPVPTRRELDQPTEAELNKALTVPQGHVDGAWIVLQDSFIAFGFNRDQARLTMYRFKKLADAGYYDKLTFHRVEPELLVQGGSPGANEFSGTARFWSDEIGAPHLAGSVALSTRGRNTGDGQFFIDLFDAPQFDHDYTVFGQGCVPVKVLEGTHIIKVIVFPPIDNRIPCQ